MEWSFIFKNTDWQTLKTPHVPSIYQPTKKVRYSDYYEMIRKRVEILEVIVDLENTVWKKANTSNLLLC